MLTLPALTIDPDALAYYRLRAHNKAVRLTAHYFVPVTGGDWAPPKNEPAATWCGEMVVRRYGDAVPATICQACENAWHVRQGFLLRRVAPGFEGPAQRVTNPLPLPLSAAGPVA